MKRTKRIAAAALCLLFILPALWARAAQPARITLRAPETPPAAGDVFSVALEIGDNPGLLSAQISLTYDPARVTCSSITPGPALAGGMSAANPAAGAGLAMVSVAASSPMEGDGVLALFTFTALTEGDPAFSVTRCELRDPAGEILPCTGDYPPPSPPAEDPAPPADSPAGPSAAQPPADPAPEAPPVFSDVPAGHWAWEMISAAGSGLLDGFPDGAFRPADTVTRAQFVALLWKLAGKPAVAAPLPFTDVADADWYAAPLRWAVREGLAGGYEDGRFDPDGAITREQAFTLLYRQAGSPALSGDPAPFAARFADAHLIHPYALAPCRWAWETGLVTGRTDTTLAPGGAMLRAEAAALVFRIANP